MNNQRKFLLNRRAFKLYREKGFLKPYHENACGWFDLDVENIETETLYEKNLDNINICFSQLPNGNWIASNSIFYGNAGQASRPSIYSEEYPTKNAAIQNQINLIINFLSRQNAPNHIIMLVKNFLSQKEQISLF